MARVGPQCHRKEEEDFDNLYRISSRLFRVTASMVALTDISFCCESGSSCFSSVH